VGTPEFGIAMPANEPYSILEQYLSAGKVE
jgi:hypothetical protein